MFPSPAARHDGISVWAFTAVHRRADLLRLSDDAVVTIPTVAGYTAIKVCAWLDRSEPKDAADLALALRWSCESRAVRDHLYDDADGTELLVAEDFDLDVAAARHLGRAVATVIGLELVTDLIARWRGSTDAVLVRELRLVGQNRPGGPDRRADLLDAFGRGLVDR